MGENGKPWLAGFGGVMVSALSVAGLMADQTWPFYLGVAGVAGYLSHQVSVGDSQSPGDVNDYGRSGPFGSARSSEFQIRCD